MNHTRASLQLAKGEKKHPTDSHIWKLSHSFKSTCKRIWDDIALNVDFNYCSVDPLWHIKLNRMNRNKVCCDSVLWFSVTEATNGIT